MLAERQSPLPVRQVGQGQSSHRGAAPWLTHASASGPRRSPLQPWVPWSAAAQSPWSGGCTRGDQGCQRREEGRGSKLCSVAAHRRGGKLQQEGSGRWHSSAERAVQHAVGPGRGGGCTLGSAVARWQQWGATKALQWWAR